MYLTCITITQSTIITSPIGFNIGLTNVDARLKQRCINVVPTLCNVVSTLCNVVSTLFQRRALTLYQCCATLKIWRQILFHFQRRINVISTLIQNIETMLIRRWNVDLEAFLFEMILFYARLNIWISSTTIYRSSRPEVFCRCSPIIHHCIMWF